MYGVVISTRSSPDRISEIYVGQAVTVAVVWLVSTWALNLSGSVTKTRGFCQNKLPNIESERLFAGSATPVDGYQTR